METIIKGYILHKQDYKVYDEIITFLGSNGIKYTCISLGSKKINSKNARNLFIGSLNEFEFFKSRNENSISRLKKSKCIVDNGWDIEKNSCLQLLNYIILKTVYTSKSFYTFYSSLLKYIIDNKDDEETKMYILQKFCELVGIEIDSDKIRKVFNLSFDKKIDSNVIKQYIFYD